MFRDHAEPSHEVIKEFFDYAKSLIGTILDSQDSLHLHSDDWQRTIYIDSLGVKTTDFDLNDATKQRLVDAGTTGVRTYFAWYDDPANKPANRSAAD